MSYVMSVEKPVENKAVNTVTESKTIYEFSSLEDLIEKLCAIRRSVNDKVSVYVSGGPNMGYKITCSWERPMTAEEIERQAHYRGKAEEAAKQMRRTEYEKLKAEFENDG